MSEITLSIKDFTDGLQMRLDETLAKAGSFRLMRNARITDRGGIAKRQGISVLGDYDSSGSYVKGLYHFEKSDGSDILLKAKGTFHQYLDTTWATLESGLTASRTGYAPHVVNTDYDDYLYWSSRDNGYRRWTGWYERTTAVLAGAETKIPVTSTLKADIHYSGTAAGVTTTTLDVTGTPWSTDVWKGFYVRITSGTYDGQIRLISAGTSSQITFATLTGLSGTPTFEIRQLAVPATGTVLLNGADLAYTAVTADDGLTVASAPAAASGSPVVLKPTHYPANPKGDSLDVYLKKMVVGNIKSAVANKGSGDVATSVSRAVYISANGDATDFTFSAPRSADEGDIIELAYGGGRVLDVAAQENAIYIGTPNYVEKLTYTTLADPAGDTDISQREPLKPGIGLTGKFIKGKDDIYFFTPAGEFTSIGRVANLDSTPQSLDIGLPIRRLLNDRVNDEAVGLEWKNRIYIAHKADSDSTFNDRVLVYNRATKSFEGDWLFPASAFCVWNGLPVFGQSNGANVFQMHSGEVDVWDGVEYPISTEVKSNWINVTSSGMGGQSVTGLHVMGFIRGDSEFDLSLMADFNDSPIININFKGSETDYIYSANVTGALGQVPLGEQPLASVDEADAEGYRRFRFTVWFPDQYMNHWSWGVKASGSNEYVEINQVGVSVSADVLEVYPGLIKEV